MPQNLQQNGGPSPGAAQRPPAAVAAGPYAGADYKNAPSTGYQNAFETGGGYQTGGPANGFRMPQIGVGGYPPFPDPGFAAAAAVTAGYRFPAAAAGGGEHLSPGQQPYALHDYDFSQLAGSQEFGQQQQLTQPGFPAQPYSLENFGERPDSAASGSDEHAARHAVPGKRPGESRFPADDFFLQPTAAAADGSVERPSGRGAPDDRRDSHSDGDGIAPLTYHSDSSGAEDQERLKQTVQRFLSMLQKKPCERQIHASAFG